jgi:hypothetical protein
MPAVLIYKIIEMIGIIGNDSINIWKSFIEGRYSVFCGLICGLLLHSATVLICIEHFRKKSQ